MDFNTTASKDTKSLLTPDSGPTAQDDYDELIKAMQDIRGAITKNYISAVSKIQEYFKVPEASKDSMEIGLSVFAVVNHMITCSACIVTACWFIFLVFNPYPWVAGDLTILAIVHTLSAIAFGFSIILRAGLSQKKPAYMIAYYVYGMTVVLIGLVQTIPVLFISLLSMSSYYTNTTMLQISLGVTLFSILYYVILSMVWATYKNMLKEQKGQKNEEQQKDDQRKDDQQKDKQQKDELPKDEQQTNSAVVETV